MQKKFADTKYLRIFVVLLAINLQLKTNIMTNLIENKTVKVIKDFTGDEWNALVIIGRIAIVKNKIGKYVQMFCASSEYAYGYISEYDTLQDACNAIHPNNVK